MSHRINMSVSNPIILACMLCLTFACSENQSNSDTETTAPQHSDSADDASEVSETSRTIDQYDSKSAPLVTHIYTADPSAHVFNDRLYIYPSHDVDSGIPSNNAGDHFDMRDYRVLSMDSVGGEVTEHGVALSVDDIPWATRQLWAPDAAEKDGKYYLYFPARDKDNIFRIGVAVSDSPTGPFVAEPSYMKGSYSIDPAVYKADDGNYYIYIGGIWGGQLERWQTGEYVAEDIYPADDEPSIMPVVAKLSDDMLSFDGELQKVMLLDTDGEPIRHGDNDKRFFEAAWVHKHNGKYYFSWSTGDTHNIAYGIGDNPLGPFHYKGVILEPVVGWTNHHSIAKFQGKWYLFYHDSSLSGGQTHLRSVKMAELVHNEDGTIQTYNAYHTLLNK
ncbi:glycoside hydrolase family 43 protein [Ningiella sp. W23]|uniref:glycoside hydrolase family 43 protein n=1 Tax=Ningiella sp. W23 TaxID=3023715 RepID=UPI0037575CEE